MNSMKSKELYTQAIERWGKSSQIEMLIEELAELTMALQKFKRDMSPERAAEVCDEMADVEIMLEQNKLIFSEETIAMRKVFKLERLQTTLRDTMYEKYTLDEEKLDQTTK